MFVLPELQNSLSLISILSSVGYWFIAIYVRHFNCYLKFTSIILLSCCINNVDIWLSLFTNRFQYFIKEQDQEQSSPWSGFQYKF